MILRQKEKLKERGKKKEVKKDEKKEENKKEEVKKEEKKEEDEKKEESVKKEERKEENESEKNIETPKTKKTGKKKHKTENTKTAGALSSQELSNLYKMLDENIDDEKDDLDINNSTIRENSNLIDLKINLDKNFKINDLYTYDINLINKMNSGLFESFLFSSNQNIIESDRLVFVDEFLPFTLKKNEECDEDSENRYIIIPTKKFSSIMELINKKNCQVC